MFQYVIRRLLLMIPTFLGTTLMVFTILQVAPDGPFERALKQLQEPCEVRLTTDSQYVVKGMTEWMKGWISNGWKTASRQPVKNRELWQELEKVSRPHDIEWIWVKGHNGHPQNERCDQLANEAIMEL